MPDLTAKRTLVKSPPELWEELSGVDRLAKHLGAFGEITITKLEPEHTVAWEGERASGTVSIEPSGWGTKVTLRAELPETAEPEPATDPLDEAQHIGQPGGDQRVELPPEAPAREPEPEPEGAAEAEPDAAAEEAQHVDDHIRRLRVEPQPTAEEEPRRGFWGWLFRRRTEPVTTAPMPAEPVAAEPEPSAREPERAAREPEPVAAATEPEPSAREPERVAREPEPVAAEPAPDPLIAEPEAAPEPEPVAAEPAPEPKPADPEPAPAEPALDPERARVILDEALDALGAAHHRPFSRG